MMYEGCSPASSRIGGNHPGRRAFAMRARYGDAGNRCAIRPIAHQQVEYVTAMPYRDASRSCAASSSGSFLRSPTMAPAHRRHQGARGRARSLSGCLQHSAHPAPAKQPVITGHGDAARMQDARNRAHACSTDAHNMDLHLDDHHNHKQENRNQHNDQCGARQHSNCGALDKKELTPPAHQAP